MHIPTLETARLRFRPITINDEENFYEIIYSDPDVMKTLPGGVPRPREAIENAVHSMLSHWDKHGLGLWAIEIKQSNTFIGHGGLMRFTADDASEIEVAYGIGKAYWGHGYATEIARESLRYGFDVIGTPYILAVAVPENTASFNVMQKCGMTYWKDVETYGMTLPCYKITAEAFSESGKRPTPRAE